MRTRRRIAKLRLRFLERGGGSGVKVDSRFALVKMKDDAQGTGA
jgi:hypothetical protein